MGHADGKRWNVHLKKRVDEGSLVLRRQLRRSELLAFFKKIPSCVVGLEACGGAHHWAREISALGHEVRLIPPAYVKPYVKRGKNDAADAEAICEAVGRPSMRFVPVKTIGQQAAAMLLKSRDSLVRQRTQTINALRGHLAELGITATRGVGKVDDLVSIVRDENDARVPPLARTALLPLTHQIDAYTAEIAKLEKAHGARSQTGCDLEPTDHNSWRGTNNRRLHCGICTRPTSLQVCSPFCGLDRANPEIELHGWEDQIGKNLKDGKPGLAISLGRGVVRRHPARASGCQGLRLVDRSAEAQAVQGCSHCAGEQDGPNRMGSSGKGWTIP